MCKLKGNNSIIIYKCMDINADCNYHQVRRGSTILTCKYLSKNTELYCESDMCNVNKMILDFKKMVKDLNIDVSKILKP